MDINSPNDNDNGNNDNNNDNILGTKRGSITYQNNPSKSPKPSENATFGPSTMLNINKQAQDSATIINDNMITNILNDTNKDLIKPTTLFGFFSYIFSPNTKNNNGDDIDDDMFDDFVTSINQMPEDEVCKPLPDVKKDGGYTVNDIDLNQQIYINDEPDNIYIIKSINGQNINIQQIDKVSNEKTIPITAIDNIINFNPESLHINQKFIDNINTINPNDFGDNEKGLILKNQTHQ